MRGPALDLKASILERIHSRTPFTVWTPRDFLDLGPRDAVDQALHRLVRGRQLRRLARGLYDMPTINTLTGKPTNADPRDVVDALARTSRGGVLVDGLTAANDLGFSDAVPARIIIHTDARLKPIQLGNLEILFKTASPSKLVWAGRPAMRLVQALYWLRDAGAGHDPSVDARIARILDDPDHGPAIADDLTKDFAALPIWMQKKLRDFLPQVSIASKGCA